MMSGFLPSLAWAFCPRRFSAMAALGLSACTSTSIQVRDARTHEPVVGARVCAVDWSDEHEAVITDTQGIAYVRTHAGWKNLWFGAVTDTRRPLPPGTIMDSHAHFSRGSTEWVPLDGWQAASDLGTARPVEARIVGGEGFAKPQGAGQ